MNLTGRFLKRNYFWISVEGVDGAGKTRLIKEIAPFLHKKYGKRFRIFLINEFSCSPFGELIKQIIAKKRFFILGEKKKYIPFAETLILAGDFIYQFEQYAKTKSKRKIIIISDRGPHTFFTYQAARIQYIYRKINENILEKWIENIFYPIGFPDFSLLLISPTKEIQQRIDKCGKQIKFKELRFLESLQGKYLKIFKESKNPYALIENRNTQWEETLKHSLRAIKTKLEIFE